MVITGAGIVCSLGSRVPEVWEALLSGRTGIRPIEGFDPSGFACSSGGPGPPSGCFRSEDPPQGSEDHGYPFLSSDEGCPGRFQRARLEETSIPREEIGFFAGMGMVDYEIGGSAARCPEVLERGGRAGLFRLLFQGIHGDLSSVASFDVEQYQFLPGRDEPRSPGREHGLFSPCGFRRHGCGRGDESRSWMAGPRWFSAVV